MSLVLAKAMRQVCRTLVFFGLWLMPNAAAAQSAPAELSNGYALLSVEGNQFPIGWFADVAAQLGGALWVVGNVHGSYDSRDIEVAQLRTSTQVAVYDVGGGVRVQRRSSRLQPFVQVLVGWVRVSATTKFESLVPGIPGDLLATTDASDTGGLMQIGAGMTMWSGPGVGVKAAVEYQRMVFDDNAELKPNAWRIGVGAAFRLQRP